MSLICDEDPIECCTSDSDNEVFEQLVVKERKRKMAELEFEVRKQLEKEEEEEHKEEEKEEKEGRPVKRAKNVDGKINEKKNELAEMEKNQSVEAQKWRNRKNLSSPFIQGDPDAKVPIFDVNAPGAEQRFLDCRADWFGATNFCKTLFSPFNNPIQHIEEMLGLRESKPFDIGALVAMDMGKKGEPKAIEAMLSHFPGVQALESNFSRVGKTACVVTPDFVIGGDTSSLAEYYTDCFPPVQCGEVKCTMKRYEDLEWLKTRRGVPYMRRGAAFVQILLQVIAINNWVEVPEDIVPASFLVEYHPASEYVKVFHVSFPVRSFVDKVMNGVKQIEKCLREGEVGDFQGIGLDYRDVSFQRIV